MHAFFDSIPAQADGSAHCAPLPDYAVVAAAGADALPFLHGQLTQDVTGLPADSARLSGYCTAKGRLLATLVLWRALPVADPQAQPDAPQLYALARRDLTDTLVKRLSMFVLRAKAKLATAPLHVAGVWCEPEALAALQDAVGGTLPATPWQRAELACGTWIGAPAAGTALRWWWIASDAQLQQAGSLATRLVRGSPDLWRSADLAAGLPWVGATTQDLFIPQTLNLDLLGGVSFTKGCYPGQEVVARSHYRGTVKRRTAYGRLDGTTEPPAPGTDIYDATQPQEPCGRVIEASRDSVLFEIALAALAAGELRVGAPDGQHIAVAPLPYALAEGAVT
ncbi:folate-binding protein YgfZ [Bordetella sp. BOR01]|uniref:CAF17-like 4Fe-4S cluster assembly/insertion protein YgfZ n=1 Tax=Bordetella sp. BOR01 TaxID=2854779 RepID=UPI001C455A9A|nr:folate-binding protein [Bordetella sp. BOR01]MBV7485974.1 folate-binding protein [Bordetella sp. BOR01]